MVVAIMDDKESLHKRREWVSQYQLENIQTIESKICERRKIVQVRGGDVAKFIMRYPVSTIMSITVICFMILNLNQGASLHGYLSANKVHHQSHGLRSLGKVATSTNCLKTPFVTPQEAAYSTPITSAWYPNNKPSHIKLCEELIKRNDFVTNPQANEDSVDSNKASMFHRFIVHETPQYCADWSKPHSALLQMISSSIIAYVGERFGLEYRHNCHKVLDAEYTRNLNFDVTTVQEIFPDQKMPIDESVLQLGEVVHELCESCIKEYTNNKNEAYGGGHETPYHCMTFPDRGGVKKTIVSKQIQGPNGMPQTVQREAQVDSQGKVFHSALESVLPLVRNRLWHVARDWQVEAKIPLDDLTTGVVIFIDSASSMPIPFHLYKQFIPPFTTQIHILSGPSCAQGKLTTTSMNNNNIQSLSCLQHGAELRDYLHDTFQDSGVQVAFNLVSSTATQYTRMIQTSALICPPNTMSCLLPALAKDAVKSVVLFETPHSGTNDWFSYLANSISSINIVRLPAQQMAIDRQQQFVQAKYAGFSAEQLIGRKPAGLYRPSPGSSTSMKDDRSINADYDMNAETDVYVGSTGRGSFTPDVNPTIHSYVQGENSVPQSAFDTPDVSHLFDAISNHKGGVSSSSSSSFYDSEVRTYGDDTTIETQRSSTPDASSSSLPQYDSTSETSVGSYQEEYPSETSVSVEDAEEYELLETDITDFTPSRTIDTDNTSKNDQQVGETDINVNYNKAAFKDHDKYNDSLETSIGETSIGETSIDETSIGRTQNVADMSLLFSNGSPPDRSQSSPSVDMNEQLMETEVDIDYKNLFH